MTMLEKIKSNPLSVSKLHWKEMFPEVANKIEKIYTDIYSPLDLSSKKLLEVVGEERIKIMAEFLRKEEKRIQGSI